MAGRKPRSRIYSIFIICFSAVVCLFAFAVAFTKWQGSNAENNCADLYYEYTDAIVIRLGSASRLHTDYNAVTINFADGNTVAFVGANCNKRLYCYMWQVDGRYGKSFLDAKLMDGSSHNVDWNMSELGGMIFCTDPDIEQPLYFAAEIPCGLTDGYSYTFELGGMNDFIPVTAPRALF